MRKKALHSELTLPERADELVAHGAHENEGGFGFSFGQVRGRGRRGDEGYMVSARESRESVANLCYSDRKVVVVTTKILELTTDKRCEMEMFEYCVVTRGLRQVQGVNVIESFSPELAAFSTLSVHATVAVSG